MHVHGSCATGCTPRHAHAHIPSCIFRTCAQFYWDEDRLKSRYDDRCVTSESGSSWTTQCNWNNCKLKIADCSEPNSGESDTIAKQAYWFDNRKACRVRSGWCAGIRQFGLDCDADGFSDPACNGGGGYFSFAVRDPATGGCVDNTATPNTNSDAQEQCSLTASPMVGLQVKDGRVFPGLEWQQVHDAGYSSNTIGPRS